MLRKMDIKINAFISFDDKYHTNKKNDKYIMWKLLFAVG